jgi:outer membrane protein OmpA-like peptidoglycan-associated protein
MKVILLILIVPLLLCCSIRVSAQQTGLQGINYQAIARDGQSNIIALRAIQVKFSILDGFEGGPAVYVELQNATTGLNGLFTLMIGKGAPLIGSFSDVNWSKGNQFLQVDISLKADGVFTTIGIMPFMSVPYALYAANGGSGGGSGGTVNISWLGSYIAPPANPLKNQAYYNSVDRKAYIYDSTNTWQILAQDGNSGTSVYWLGTFATDPAGPALNQAYYNLTDRKAYIYDGTAWQIMSQDGTSLHWLGTFATVPATANYNDGYYNTTDRTSYIYDGAAWQILAEGGSGFKIQTLSYKPTGASELTTSVGDVITSPNRAWIIGGNTGTDGSADFIGTLDAVPLIIKTGGNGTLNERMRFNADTDNGILINGTTDTTNAQGRAMLAVYSSNAPLALNKTSGVLLNAINGYSDGNASGIFGRNYSNGTGVRGVSANGVGVYGYSNNKTAIAMKGDNSAIDGGFGVMGVNSAPSVISTKNVISAGVYGKANNAAGMGVVGIGNNIDYSSYTASNIPFPTAGAGVAGLGASVGIYGIGGQTGTSGAALGIGVAGGGTGVKPVIPTYGAGVTGSSNNVGVAGYGLTNALGTDINRWGGYFEYRYQNPLNATFNAFTYIYLAGRDAGGVMLGLATPGTKSTIVKDDEGNRRLLYCTEAPEVLFQDFGAGQLNNGTAHIDLERLLTKSIRVDEKHPLKVFIQLEGECNGVFVTNKSATGFDVKELQKGTSDVPFTWQIVASRADEIAPDGSRIPYSDGRFGAAPGPLESTIPANPADSVTKVELKTEEAAVVNKAFKNLQFSTGKAQIAKSSLPSLDNIATLLQAHPEWHMKLSGHTDNEGTPAFNQTLSEKRSEAVKQYLATKGIDTKRIITAGYGQSKPLTTNQTKSEREKNRRVEMEIFTEQ